MKPDIIISWPRNCDYPLWRQMIHDNRTRFNEVVIVFTETNYGLNYRDFIRLAMFPDHIMLVESPAINAPEDWRDIAVNFGLSQSLHSEWLWFTEQDFFPEGIFWDIVSDGMQISSAIGVLDGERLHPCSLFLKREVLQQTKKRFHAASPDFDHFGQIQKDLRNLHIEPLILPQTSYLHMAGLSHNLRLITDGQRPNHKVDQFNDYIKRCLEVTVPLHPLTVELYKDYLASL